MASTGAVRVKGFRELDRALTGLDRSIKRGMRRELREVAEPVRALAEQLAVGNITNIGAHWARMRVGVTARSVYVAPTSRRAGGSPRPNLADLLMGRAMQPALDSETDDVIRGLEMFIDRAADRQGF